jgi:probable phosphoglycerate mutase
VEADPGTGSASAAPGERGVLRVPGEQPALVLIRHGETEWSRTGRHTGRTDVELTEAGRDQAVAAGEVVRRAIGDVTPSLVISSPRRRALHTAELAGFVPTTITEDAGEWDYGDLEGLTSAQIQQTYPGWSIWSGPVPGGEDRQSVTTRFDRLLSLVTQHAGAGPVLVFSHGHASRCLAARWLTEPVATGQHYWLGTGAVSTLGNEHGRPVILRWNLDKSIIDPRA